MKALKWLFAVGEPYQDVMFKSATYVMECVKCEKKALVVTAGMTVAAVADMEEHFKCGRCRDEE